MNTLDGYELKEGDECWVSFYCGSGEHNISRNPRGPNKPKKDSAEVVKLKLKVKKAKTPKDLSVALKELNKTRSKRSIASDKARKNKVTVAVTDQTAERWAEAFGDMDILGIDNPGYVTQPTRRRGRPVSKEHRSSSGKPGSNMGSMRRK